MTQQRGEQEWIAECRAQGLMATGSDQDEPGSQVDAAANGIVRGRVAGVQGNQPVEPGNACRGNVAGNELQILGADPVRHSGGLLE